MPRHARRDGYCRHSAESAAGRALRDLEADVDGLDDDGSIIAWFWRLAECQDRDQLEQLMPELRVRCRELVSTAAGAACGGLAVA
jgi:hypothetical protein